MSPGRVSVSLKSAKALESVVTTHQHARFLGSELTIALGQLRQAISHATRERPALKKAAAKRSKKKREKSKDTKSIRALVMERARGRCECCLMDIGEDRLQLDHMFGRVRQKQSVSNCWALADLHHMGKTNNVPTAETWLTKFLGHALRHGYAAEAREVRKRLESLSLQAEAESLTAPKLVSLDEELRIERAPVEGARHGQ